MKQAIETYLSENHYPKFCLKAVLFDMDGVLYDSMSNHAEAWNRIMNMHGLPFSLEDAYLHEGRTGADTIEYICNQHGLHLSDDDIRSLYEEKAKYFETCPPPQPMPGSYELLQKVVRDGLMPMIVTGSGQVTLWDELNVYFPGIFRRDRMVTSLDVKRGKPNPDPYLMALDKGQLQPQEAIVVENAPLGVEAARAAGLFTIAVNTGILPDQYLLDAGANLLFRDMPELCAKWDAIRDTLCSCGE
ncbi:MAG: HAD-IA family hydrolase [Tannerella sp.]|jgi:HAD superfamily hydrolase (TIGR01509 family)|nr:HAD-IA family hydrolase [Tannerella sp.]